MRTRRIVCMAFLASGAACGAAAQTWLEDFETGTKSSYASNDVTCTMGSWNMNDALIGSLVNDKTIDSKSVRIQNNGYISMNFDKTNGTGILAFYIAKYGSDVDATALAEYSIDGGTNWTQAGETISVTNPALAQIVIPLNVTNNVRFRISQSSSGDKRINIDNIEITDYIEGGTPPWISTLAAQTVRLGETLGFGLTIIPTEDDPVIYTNVTAEGVSGAYVLEEGWFSYTPLATDFGVRNFTFAAADKDGTNTISVSVKVCQPQVQAVVMDEVTGAYAQDFDAMESAGTPEWDNLAWPLPVWSAFAGAPPATSYRAGNGSGTAGGLYSWGNDADRALGSLASNEKNYCYGLAFTNATGQTVTNLSVSFTAEQWRVAFNAEPNALGFEYCVTNRALPLIEGNWRRVKALCFESPLVTNETQAAGACCAAAALSATIPWPVAAGEVVLLRWSDPDDTGSDHGFGIDDLTVAWAAGVMPEAILVTLDGAREDFDEMSAAAAEDLPWMWRLEARDDAPRVSGAYTEAGGRTTRTNPSGNFTAAGGYNFAAASALDRAVGGLSDAAAAKSVTLFGKFANATGRALRNWDISYNVEKYRNGTLATAVQLLVSADGVTWQAAGAPRVFAADDNTDGFAADAQPVTTVAEQRQVTLAAPVEKGGVFYLAWQIAVADGEVTEGAQALGVDEIMVMPRVSRGSVMKIK